MNLETHLEKVSSLKNLELLAFQIVEGFISGMHKSPFHGFSAEFAEHKVYNIGESTKHIDWKLFAKTDRLYTKRFEEETNLRCHIIIDNSSSMHYPILKNTDEFYQNKIGFSVLASAVLLRMLKKQRDAAGLSVFSDTYEYYTSEKGSDRHFRMILSQLESVLQNQPKNKTTNTATFLHQIAEKMHRRSLIILFTDMFQGENDEKLFEALQHLKHNKHKVILFHVIDKKTELHFDFDTTPRKFIDLETGDFVNLFTNNVKTDYESKLKDYFAKILNVCALYKIKYVPVSVDLNFETVLTTFLIEKERFR